MKKVVLFHQFFLLKVRFPRDGCGPFGALACKIYGQTKPNVARIDRV